MKNREINILYLALLIVGIIFTVYGAVDQAFHILCLAVLIILAEYVYKRKRAIDEKEKLENDASPQT